MTSRQDAIEGLKAVAERNNTARDRAIQAFIRASGRVARIAGKDKKVKVS